MQYSEDPLGLLRSVFHRSGRSLTYVGAFNHLPASALRVVATLGTTVVELNLSFCEVDRDLRPLEAMYALKTLILDNSSIGDRHIFPYLYHLETLSLNKNSLHDLDGLLHNLSNLNPNLVHLSLLGNVACPHPLIQGTDSVNEAAYHRYRVQVARQLPRLKFLDARAILEGERLESMRSGHIGLTNVVIKKVEEKKKLLWNRKSANSGPLVVYKNKASVSRSEDNVDGLGGDLERGCVIESGKSSASFYGRLRYKYSGKHSEGNRFIKDPDL